MLFVSSTASQHTKIRSAIEDLHANGFSNLELTGGTTYYEIIMDDVRHLRNRYNLNILLHNYFPPPKVDFVLNLASLDRSISQKSLNFCKNSIDLSRQINANKIGFHAGFLLDIPVNQIGKEILREKIYDKDKALDQLYENYSALQDYSNGDVDIYLENNVFSQTNAMTFGGENPFLLTDYNDYCQIRKQLDFHFLLDLAHLYVSSTTLHLSFSDQADKLIGESDYLHISNNDGYHDLHLPFTPESKILEQLKTVDLKGKILTLEIKSDMSSLKRSYDLVEKTII